MLRGTLANSIGPTSRIKRRVFIFAPIHPLFKRKLVAPMRRVRFAARPVAIRRMGGAKRYPSPRPYCMIGIATTLAQRWVSLRSTHPTSYNRRLSCSCPAPPRTWRRLVEFVGADIADRPEVHALLAPAQHAEALQGFHLRRLAFGIAGLRHEQIDDVLAPLVNHRADRCLLYTSD